MRAALVAGTVGLLLLFGVSGTARAAQVIGQTGTAIGCDTDRAFVQTSQLSGASYSPTGPGVITSWSTIAGPTYDKTLKLLVLQPDPALYHFTAVAKDQVRTLTQVNVLNVYTGLHLPIGAGQRIGLYVPAAQSGGGFGTCSFSTPDDGDVLRSTNVDGEPALNTSADYSDATTMYKMFRLNASAVVEPDADRDGFGDETQDQCPALASVQTACPLPAQAQAQTPITKKCKRGKSHHKAAAAKKRCKHKKHT